MKHIIGIDIGKTKIAIGIVDFEGKLYEKKQVKTDMINGGMSIINQCEELINQTMTPYVVGIGVGSSGVIEPKSGIALSSGSIPGWENIKIKEIFEKKFKKRSFIDNDVNAAALGEFTFGVGKQFSSLVLLTISTGVGFASIIDNKIFRGSHGLAGQIAHIPVMLTQQSVNDILSGKGIENQAKEIIGKDCTTEDVFIHARNGNEECAKIIENATNLGASLITWIYNTIDPAVIVFSGSVVLKDNFLLDNIRKKAKIQLQKYRSHRTDGLQILKSQLGDNTGILGAVAIYLANYKI